MFQRLKNSFRYALRGLRYIWQTEQSFRIQALVALVLIFALLVLNFSYVEDAAIILAIILVLVLETVNTIVEKILDALKPGQDNLVGKIKDMMAAAVLVGSSGALVIGLLTVWHHFSTYK
jgi:diacylglycerol kinase (ATP)